MSLKHVVQGYSNSTLDKMGKLDASKQKIANDRLEICKSCDILDKSSMRCQKSKGGCGCKMDKKVFSMSAKCPKSKW